MKETRRAGGNQDQLFCLTEGLLPLSTFLKTINIEKEFEGPFYAFKKKKVLAILLRSDLTTSMLT
jgi:hypothetical protein